MSPRSLTTKDTKTTPAPALPEALLVAVDFSPGSRRALDLALAWGTQGEVTALHVIDTEFAQRVEANGFGSSADVIARLRLRAEEEFRSLFLEKGADAFDSMIVEGAPFVEIVKIAKDLQVDLIAIGMARGSSRVDQLLFGGTAEKVLRASSCPVLCVP
jgi:nucleotide-binding universal stress UspA family protein